MRKSGIIAFCIWLGKVEVTKKAMGWGRAANICIRLMDRTESYVTQKHNLVGG